jgi:hypothetical protein
MSLLRAAGAASLLLFATACGVASSYKVSADETGNACETDADCGDGRCTSGVCEARGNGLRRVMVEITPPTSVSSGEYAKVRYRQAQLIDVGGTLDFPLDVVAELSVAVLPPREDCTPPGLDATGYLPIKVTAFADAGINGIDVSTIEAKVDPAQQTSADGNVVALSLAPGSVDLYIEPTSEATTPDSESVIADDCTLAPLLARGQAIAPGRVSLTQRLSVAQHLNVDVHVPTGPSGVSAFEGWTLDMVDPLGGRRLSSRVVLGYPTTTADGQAHHQVELAYHSVVGNGAEQLAGSELFRLTPATGVLGPTYYVARSVMDLSAAGSVVLSQQAAIPSAVVVSGSVESDTDKTPVRADVTAVLNPGDISSAGTLASFRTATSTDSEGRFELQLLAGSYTIVAVPSAASGYASLSTQWTVAPSPAVQAGKLIRVVQSATLTGVVLSESSKEPLSVATIAATPSTNGKRPTFLDEVLGDGVPIGVRSQMVVSDPSGTFSLAVDPGRYDIAVRPADSTGYPWAIRPNTGVDDVGVKGVMSIQVRNPVAYTGTVTVPGRSADAPRVVLPGALLRVYALFDDHDRLAEDDVSAVYAVEIGESRADSAGVYQLLLPDQLN